MPFAFPSESAFTFAGIRRNEEIIGSRKGRVRCKERLGGLLKYYHREAA